MHETQQEPNENPLGSHGFAGGAVFAGLVERLRAAPLAAPFAPAWLLRRNGPVKSSVILTEKE